MTSLDWSTGVSQRPPVDRERIERFLEELGRRFRHTGTVYLMGGTSMVYEGFRAQTLDVDLTYEVADSDHAVFIEILRTLKNEPAISIKEASPGEFVPLPLGHQDRVRFVGRYGQVDVFHYDPYSVALGKIVRGREADFADVVALLKAAWIEFDILEGHFAAILPRVGKRSLKADPDEFERKLAHLKGVWQGKKDG